MKYVMIIINDYDLKINCVDCSFWIVKNKFLINMIVMKNR